MSVGFKVLGAKKKVMLDLVYYGVFIGHTNFLKFIYLRQGR